MIAYKFLKPDGTGIFSGFRWRVDEWVEAPAEACVSGIHACRIGDLPYWVARSMWEIELDGDIHEGRMKVVASRGRLIRRVEEWDDAALDEYVDMCAARAHELAAEAGPDWDAVIEPSKPEGPALLGFIPARIAEELDGPDAYHRERAAQADWLVRRLGLRA